MKKIKKIKTLLGQEYRNYKTYQSRNLEHDLTSDQTTTLDSLRKRGFAVVENFYSPEKCQELRTEMDRLINQYRDKIWIDDAGSDHRVFGANRISRPINEFYEDKRIIEIIESYEGMERTSGFVLGAKLEAKAGNVGSGGGWHRDWAERRQTKAILYLSNVTEKNGPFEYIEDTHSSKSVVVDTLKNDFNLNQGRFEEEEIAKLLKSKGITQKTFTAKEGTLIFVDTRGIHRGMPIIENTRYALTCYTWFGLDIPNHIKTELVK